MMEKLKTVLRALAPYAARRATWVSLATVASIAGVTLNPQWIDALSALGVALSGLVP